MHEQKCSCVYNICTMYEQKCSCMYNVCTMYEHKCTCMYNVCTIYEHECSSMYNVCTLYEQRTCIPVHVYIREVPTVWIFSVPPHPSLEWSSPLKPQSAIFHDLPSQRAGEGCQEICAGPWTLRSCPSIPSKNLVIASSMSSASGLPRKNSSSSMQGLSSPSSSSMTWGCLDTGPPACMSSSRRNLRKPAFAVVA